MNLEEQYSVVIVEDEELILNNAVRKILESGLGFYVSGTAQDGKEAIKLIEDEPPDVMITDIRMPVMDGLELLRIVTSRFPYIKKIVISGHDEFAYAQQAIKYDVVDYLLKPLKMDELKAALTRIKVILDNEKKAIQQSRTANLSPQSRSAEEIVKAVELTIRENYSSDINFDQIAQEYNFSSAYLSKIFTKLFGENPSRYQVLLRINMAKHLLLAKNDMSIREVGEQVGYSDQFYFSRVFRNVTGVSPATFKSSNKIKPGSPHQ